MVVGSSWSSYRLDNWMVFIWFIGCDYEVIGANKSIDVLKEEIKYLNGVREGFMLRADEVGRRIVNLEETLLIKEKDEIERMKVRCRRRGEWI